MYSCILISFSLLLFSYPAGEGTVNVEITGGNNQFTVVIENWHNGNFIIALLTVNLFFLFLLLAFIIFLVVLWHKVSQTCVYLHCKEIICLIIVQLVR